MVVGKPKAIRSACTVQETLHKSVATPSLWILEKRPSCGQFGWPHQQPWRLLGIALWRFESEGEKEKGKQSGEEKEEEKDQEELEEEEKEEEREREKERRTMAGMSSSFPGTVTSSAPCVAAAPGSRHSLPQGAPRLHCKGGNSSSSFSFSRLPVSALKSFHHYNIRLNHLRILWFPWKYTCLGHCTQTHTWGFENQISCQGRRIGRRRIRLLEHHSVSVPAGWF